MCNYLFQKDEISLKLIPLRSNILSYFIFFKKTFVTRVRISTVLGLYVQINYFEIVSSQILIYYFCFPPNRVFTRCRQLDCINQSPSDHTQLDDVLNSFFVLQSILIRAVSSRQK